MADPHQFGIAGLIGWPVAHSAPRRSTTTGSTSYKIAGRYVLLPVPSEAVDCVAGTRGSRFPGLQRDNARTSRRSCRCSTGLTSSRDRIGAVNTIVVEKDGTLTGFNNDGNGFVQKSARCETRLAPRCGTDRRAGRRWGCKSRRAQACTAQGAREIRLVNRTFERAQRALPTNMGRRSPHCPGNNATRRWRTWHLLANATNQGMAGKRCARHFSRSACQPHALVGDLIYIPPETPLLAAAARSQGNTTVNGLGLLLNQARPAFQAWYGVLPDITPGLLRAIGTGEATFFDAA